MNLFFITQEKTIIFFSFPQRHVPYFRLIDIRVLGEKNINCLLFPL